MHDPFTPHRLQHSTVRYRDLRTVDRDRAIPVQSRELTADRLGCQTEVIRDVHADHREFDVRPSIQFHPPGHLQEESGDPLRRSHAAKQDHVLPPRADLSGRQFADPARQSAIFIGECGKAAARETMKRDLRDGLGTKIVLIEGIPSEDVARKQELTDLSPAVPHQHDSSHTAAYDQVAVFGLVILGDNFFVLRGTHSRWPRQCGRGRGSPD